MLFCQENGKIINHIAVNSIFKRICREAKVKLELETGCHFHMTRHTAITRLIEMGTNLMVIASLVGHTSTRQIEETYGHILLNFQNWQLDHPGEYYKKEDLITEKIKNLYLIYKIPPHSVLTSNVVVVLFYNVTNICVSHFLYLL